jgi:hypothetical protein
LRDRPRRYLLVSVGTIFRTDCDDDTSQMPEGELDDGDIIERLTRIFKDMPPYMACPVQEYSAARPPKEVSSRTPLVE